jgi:hypothetical protein
MIKIEIDSEAQRSFLFGSLRQRRGASRGGNPRRLKEELLEERHPYTWLWIAEPLSYLRKPR